MKTKHVLSEPDISEFIKNNPDWKLVDNKLVADFTLSSFMKAIAVINHIAAQAEKMNHHPRLSNEYNKLKVSLCTHEAGDGITELDVELAIIISKIVRDTLG